MFVDWSNLENDNHNNYDNHTNVDDDDSNGGKDGDYYAQIHCE